MNRQEKFDQYKNLVHGCIQKYFGTSATVPYRYQSFGIDYDDLTQIGFTYLWENVDEVDPNNCPSGYIYRGVWMAVRNYMRRKGSLIKMPETNKYECIWTSYNLPMPDGNGELIDYKESDLTSYAEVDNKVFFEQVSKDLRDYEAELITYRLQGLTQQQIAERVGLSRQAVQQREQIMFEKIRKMVG